ncbi:MAG: hypothetical protein GY868_03890, partial [Deltaproteobacteria bacterium]|nr:hypothetical protein [Deltaproteobacteria bacterium]
MRLLILAAAFLLAGSLPAHCSAPQWVELESGTSADLRTIWGTGPAQLYAAGGRNTTLLLYDGFTWSNLETQLPKYATADTYSIWGTSDSHIFTAGGWSYYGIHRGNILHFDGSDWTSLTAQPHSLLAWVNELRDIWGASASDIYFAGQRNFSLLNAGWIGPLLHYNGSTFTEVTNPREHISDADLSALWGAASDDIHAVGRAIDEICLDYEEHCILWGLICWEECSQQESFNYANIMHYDGTEWTHTETGINADLFDIWGSAADNVFAVGTDGTILHYDGTLWQTMESPTSQDLYSIWGSGPQSIYAVGDQGTILNFNGSSWSEMTGPTTKALNHVWGPAPDTVYAVGDDGTLLVYSALFDFGDAPAPPYPSRLIQDGARHSKTDALRLGDDVSYEPDGLHYDSDNHTGGDRYDDGISFLGSRASQADDFSLPFIGGQTGAVTISVSGLAGGTAYVHGWIDWNHDGDWDDTDENIICGYACTEQGDYTIEFPIPAVVSESCTWARFRIDLDENLCTPLGAAAAGEVEDYEICPTLIELEAFSATRLSNEVNITWTTSAEINTSGFNLYRSESEQGSYTKINTALIPSRGGPHSGETYHYIDTNVPENATLFYLLEEIDTDNNTARYGPVAATAAFSASACSALADLDIDVTKPQYPDQGDTLSSCYAFMEFSNTGKRALTVFWQVVDTYGEESRQWNSVSIEPGESYTGTTPDWRDLEFNYDVTRSTITTEVAAL